jgi:DNA-binding SARP family transcriptional activator
MTLRLRTFGAVYLERDGTPLAGAHSQRRRLALLAYLAAANNAAITRDKLFALLWPESDDTSARHSLSQLLYALRHDLGPGAIAIDSETARLDPAYLASDVHEFDLALRDGRLEDAAALYLGAFLDGFHVDHAAGFNRWADEERSRRATECAGLLDRLAEQATSSGDQHRRVDWCRRRVALDAMDGRATLRLMEALAAIGDREGALRAARVYEALIRDELDSAADPAVLQLAERLRHPAAAAPTPPPNEARVVAAPPPAAVTVDQPRESAAAPRRWWPRVAATLGIAALVLLGVRQSSGRRPLNLASSPLGASVVLGDLEGPDSVLALAVREALRAELVNTRGVIVTSDLGMRELKSLMRLRPDSALSLDDLLALALRAGAHVAMAGSVLPIGNGAQIVVELVDPQTGASLRTFAERPRDGSEILAAVGRIGRAVGGAITQTSRDSSVQPLPVVTTASLPALKSYAQARHLAALGMRREAVAPAERAVTHDSLFALAHYFLGDVLWFIDQQTHAEAHLTKRTSCWPRCRRGSNSLFAHATSNWSWIDPTARWRTGICCTMSRPGMPWRTRDARGRCARWGGTKKPRRRRTPPCGWTPRRWRRIRTT